MKIHNQHGCVVVGRRGRQQSSQSTMLLALLCVEGGSGFGLGGLNEARQEVGNNQTTADMDADRKAVSREAKGRAKERKRLFVSNGGWSGVKRGLCVDGLWMWCACLRRRGDVDEGRVSSTARPQQVESGVWDAKATSLAPLLCDE